MGQYIHIVTARASVREKEEEKMEQHSFLRYSVAVLLFLAFTTSSTQGTYNKSNVIIKSIEAMSRIIIIIESRKPKKENFSFFHPFVKIFLMQKN